MLVKIAFPPISLATSNTFPVLCLLLLKGLLLPGFQVGEESQDEEMLMLGKASQV